MDATCFLVPLSFPMKEKPMASRIKLGEQSKAQQLNVFSPAILCASTSFYCSPCPMQRLPPYWLLLPAFWLLHRHLSWQRSHPFFCAKLCSSYFSCPFSILFSLLILVYSPLAWHRHSFSLRIFHWSWPQVFSYTVSFGQQAVS